MLKNGLFLFTVVAVFTSTAFAKSTPTPSASDQSLKKTLLQETSKNHHAVGYDNARVDILAGMGLEKNNNTYTLKDVYCEQEYTVPGPGKMPNNSVLNVEHTWPQSKFGGKGKGSQKSDLHHLFPSDSKLNSIRGNNPFGVVVQEAKTLKCGTSKVGRNIEGGYVFEPPAAHKGNVARALFYFSVRYEMSIDPVQEAYLKQWNEDDPVDADEMARNDLIETMQGNRNPFIDHPELAHSIGDF